MFFISDAVHCGLYIVFMIFFRGVAALCELLWIVMGSCEFSLVYSGLFLVHVDYFFGSLWIDVGRCWLTFGWDGGLL